MLTPGRCRGSELGTPLKFLPRFGLVGGTSSQLISLEIPKVHLHLPHPFLAHCPHLLFSLLLVFLSHSLWLKLGAASPSPNKSISNLCLLPTFLPCSHYDLFQVLSDRFFHPLISFPLHPPLFPQHPLLGDCVSLLPEACTPHTPPRSSCCAPAPAGESASLSLSLSLPLAAFLPPPPQLTYSLQCFR